MPTLTIDGQEVTVDPGTTVLQACEEVGVEIPRFCYHERLSIAGNCRMCLVEMEKAPKPIASCAMPAGDGMVIHTNTERVKKAREGVMEFLLINHPLDCPICDQGGECDLQDQSMAFGGGASRYEENKRAVEDKYMGPLISTTMTRCIHCMRCVRFSTEVAGVDDMGSLWRGEHTEVTTYLGNMLDSEMSGNVIDLCPVGALTSKPYAFTARSWELKSTESIDVMDAVGSNIRVDARGAAVMRILPRLHEDVNEEWISDKTRFVYDGLKKRRLDRPYVRKDGKLTEASWGEAFDAIKTGVSGLKGDQIAGVVGDLADMEAMYAMKDLLANLGSSRIESRQDGAELDASVRSGYLMNSSIAGIEDADYLLMIGTNPRAEAPIINTRIRKAVRHLGLKVANIGEAVDLTYPVEEFGNDTALISKITGGRHAISKALKAAEKPMILVGQGALQGKDGAAILKMARDIADKYCIKDGWNGFNVLHTAASRVGALDLGLVSDGGIDAIKSDAEDGNLKAVFLLGADEFDTSSLKDAFTVYIGTHGDEGVKNADVILPAAAYTEKSGTYINTEGRVQMTAKAVFAPGDAREDWTIFRALSDVLGSTLMYDNLGQLRLKLVEAVPHITAIDEVPDAEWGDFGIKGDIEAGEITNAVSNFYVTNPIARTSDIMADCIEARSGEGFEEATGTNG
ncbi:NADH-quinone oxidoreductase subunit NuoG [Kordiimonas sp. SCSIO 12610]|uniref:NADH-quinone oxidoreductase subunit NuoG n=1 Tax=Kordiimonas sp. SCSIO 12610 TaxID=2829597 RepID=UPI00210C09BB|nr:NADH-quinone oxidoreductase subunit NuoG [Kordiimonas sp. SCSIO 12610]UTW54074.1 NADH-quinone oxidoreductase subunit G [Kordiimonas sp. SCSIO 12610]